MKKVVIFLLILLTCNLLLVDSVRAQVLINEFSSWNTSDDWIELYNIGDSAVDLSTYLIRDSTETNKINLSGNIEARGFSTFGFSNRLNRSSDKIRLINYVDAKEIVEDEVFYGGPGQVCSPKDGGTVGRVTDGGNVLERFFIGTKNTSNNGSQLDPCPAPTETQAPTYTPTPTLKVSTPTPTATLTLSVTKPVVKVQLSIIPTPSDTQNITEIVLADSTTAEEQPNENGDSKVDEDKKKNNGLVVKKYFLASVLVLVGCGFLIYSLYFVTKKNKKKI